MRKSTIGYCWPALIQSTKYKPLLSVPLKDKNSAEGKAPASVNVAFAEKIVSKSDQLLLRFLLCKNLEVLDTTTYLISLGLTLSAYVLDL